MKILNQKSLDEKLRQAAAVVSEKMVSEIRSFILSAEDAQLYLINPYRFAAQRKLDRTGALRAFLHLTKGGLFNLHWNVHCPACKGVTQRSTSLRTLTHADKCGVCSTVFDAGLDTSIEVSFEVNPSIIKPAGVDDFSKVIAGFDLVPGINIELERGESHFLKTDLKEGNYFLFISGEKKALNLVVASGKSTETQKISFEYRDNLPLLTIAVAKEGPAEIVIVNKERGKKVMTFARLGPQRWPRAAVVSSLQDFRDFFSSEMLSPKETFSIEAFDDLETAAKLKNSIIVKVGIHHGPCIAVALNERIDYFGTTVNIAARVQGLSDGRDVMASGAIFGESNAEEYLREKGWASDPFTTNLKGLKSSYQVHKLHAPNA